MKPKQLYYSCVINASPEEVCAFHTDTHNLPFITPSWIDVKIMSMDDPFVQNSRVSLEITRFGIRTRWIMEIEVLNCPQEVTDTMVSGPFSHFRHQRRFKSLSENQTLMEEFITLKLPFGWFANLIFWIIKLDMDKMFTYRHNATRAYFKSKNSNEPT